MSDYDRLPKDIRLWLAEAQLPWSPRSVLRLWQKALRDHQNDRQAALHYLTHCELRKIQKDAPQIWGASYPVPVTQPKARAS